MTNKELIYAAIRRYVSDIYESGQKISYSELLNWVNTHCSNLMSSPYRSLRSVIPAAWRRGTDSEKEALENAIVDRNGKSLL